MQLLVVAVSCAILVYAVLGLDDLSFPPGFKFGVSSAAYQVEGAWNVSDKSESVWDTFVHDNRAVIANGHDGDVACDSYHLWRRDIEMIEELGAHLYRFSISWSRLLPTGFPNKISEDGKRYYNNLIDGLLEKGIEPAVTIYHFDLPQSLQDLGGWTNPLIVDWFADYAYVCYSLFGDRVKIWTTINEPVVVCDYTYNTGDFPPGVEETYVSPYLCNKHVLLAHAKAYRAYDEFRPKYNGKISIANNLIFMEPLSPEHSELAELGNQYMTGRYSHAIFSKEGGWPPSLEQYFQTKINDTTWRRKLPEFSPDEINLIKGTYDYIAINHYTSRVIRPVAPGETLLPFPLGDLPDLNAKLGKHPLWQESFSPIMFVYPEGFRKQLLWVKQQYGDIPILITENGYCNEGGLDDWDRIDFLRRYMAQLLLSIKQDGVNVTGYTVWGLMDDFEWIGGYTPKLGLYEVDFSSPNRTRTPRASASFYADVIRQHSLDKL